MADKGEIRNGQYESGLEGSCALVEMAVHCRAIYDLVCEELSRRDPSLRVLARDDFVRAAPQG